MSQPVAEKGKHYGSRGGGKCVLSGGWAGYHLGGSMVALVIWVSGWVSRPGLERVGYIDKV